MSAEIEVAVSRENMNDLCQRNGWVQSAAAAGVAVVHGGAVCFKGKLASTGKPMPEAGAVPSVAKPK